jgi:hypothetical protein
MKKRSATQLAFLLACPLVGLAQSLPPATNARLYVGLGTYVSNFQPVSGNSISDLKVPLQFTAGYQLRPRLALQVGVAYSRPTFDYSTLNTTDDTPGALIVAQRYEGQSVWRRTTLSVQARYSLRQPARRFQTDLLLGYAQERELFTSGHSYTAIDNTNSVYDTSYSAENHNYSLNTFTAGLSTRYCFSSYFEVVAEGLLVGVPHHWSNPPGLAGSLGLRYRIGKLR